MDTLANIRYYREIVGAPVDKSQELFDNYQTVVGMTPSSVAI